MGVDKTAPAGCLVNHLARRFARERHARIGPLGLTPGTFPALMERWAGDGRTHRDLGGRLDIGQATMADPLAWMGREALIRHPPTPGIAAPIASG
ncbi:MAG: hypothetical protein ACXIU8_02240 [Alkalilacustris sp.]